MMMASIPGAPLSDTLPSDALLFVAKESTGPATIQGTGRRCTDEDWWQTAAQMQLAHSRSSSTSVEQQAGNGAAFRNKYSVT
jgi:hypothetical protein